MKKNKGGWLCMFIKNNSAKEYTVYVKTSTVSLWPFYLIVTASNTNKQSLTVA